MPTPLNLELYNKVKADIYAKNPKHSAYRSMAIVKQYKKEGGEYKDDGERDTTKWLGQKWSSVNDYYHDNKVVNCGNSDTQKKFNEYPLCRPLAIIKKLTKPQMKQLIDNKKDEAPLITKNILKTKKYNIKNTKTGAGVKLKSVGLKDKYKGQGIPEAVKEEIDENIPVPMGDADIHNYLPNARIYTYPQIAKYEDIEQLLPNNNDYFIVLYLDSPTTGHWNAVLRYDNKIEHFDPYGGVDKALKWQSKDRLAGLGQYDKYLSNLYNSTDLKVVYNNIAYQDEKDRSIATCGRHVVNRIQKLLKDRYSGCDYARYMKKLKKDTKLSYDEIVSGLIDN